MTMNRTTDEFAGGGFSAALRALPEKRAPEGGWRRVLERHDAERQHEYRRRRYWGGGLAVAASIAVAVAGWQMGAGFLAGTDIDADAVNPGPEAAAFGDESASPLQQMDMEALVALSQFQEERLRALPAFDPAAPGRVLEVDSFGLATELEDQIALLDEGLIPASLNAGDQAIPRRLMQERALLMEDLFDMRHAEAAQAGFIYADF